MKKNRSDDFEFTKNNFENTLDFYKENLPLNAVEKLFNESKNPTSSYNDFINKYNMTDPNFENFTPQKKINVKKRVRSNAENEFLNNFNTRNFDSNYTKPKSSFFKLFVSFLFVLFLCVITLLIFKINSLNKQIIELKSHIEENAQANEKLQTVLIENENLKKIIEDFNNPETEPEPSVPPEDESKETEYIVQAGDTLSSISKKFYGSTNFYNKIIEKNNLTNENLHVNQKLIIPEK